MSLALHIYHDDIDRIRSLLRARDPAGASLVPCADIRDAEVVFMASPPADALATWHREAKRLRLIQMMGVGIDDLQPALPTLDSNVQITCLRGVFAAEVAEHVFALLLALVRGIPTIVTRQRERQWMPFASGKLEGRRLLILGGGAVGTRVETIARALGMNVLKTITRSSASSDLDQHLPDADVVVLCLPRTPETLGLLSGARIDRLPPHALIVNVARGGIIDEAALLEALNRGNIGGVALDVFDNEPLPEDSPWWHAAPNAIISPHVAGYGLDYEGRAVDVLLENAARLEKGEPLVHLVDRLVGY